MNGQLYIELAKNLANDLKEENIRCAISRYYYGLLHKAIEKLIELDPIFSDLKDNLRNPPPSDYKYSIHSSTINSVKSYSTVTAGDLDIVRELRVLSDYNFDELILNTPINIKKNQNQVVRTFNSIDEIFKFLDETSNKISILRNKQKRSNSLSNKIDLSCISKRL